MVQCKVSSLDIKASNEGSRGFFNAYLEVFVVVEVLCTTHKSVSNVKALEGALNLEKALVGAFILIVKSSQRFV